VIEISRENLIPLTAIPRRFPEWGRSGKLAFSTVLRWVLRGVKTPHGSMKLDAVRLGAKWFTSEQALQRFAEALTGAYSPPPDKPDRARTGAAKKRIAERAADELTARGI
jgi:hypothetical protein